MGRLSDTRQRTREAASQLVAMGKSPHELTVDLIFGEIHQGSRTTINDELKAWKAEQTTAALWSESLPPSLVSAMLSAWGVAMQEAQAVYAAQKHDLEAEQSRLLLQLSKAQESHVALQDQEQEWRQRYEAMQTELIACQDILRQAKQEKVVLQQDLQKLEALLHEERTALSQQLEQQRMAFEQQRHDEQEASAQQQAQMSTELALATQRLDAVQKHVLQQVDIARLAQKNAEQQLAKSQQRNDQLSLEAQSVRSELMTLQVQYQRVEQTAASSKEQLAQIQQQHHALSEALSNSSRQLEAAWAHNAMLLDSIRVQQDASDKVSHKAVRSSTHQKYRQRLDSRSKNNPVKRILLPTERRALNP